METQTKRKAPGKKAEEVKKHYSYEELLDKLRTYIETTYGSLTKFFEHEDFINKCGFEDGDRTNKHLYTYLANTNNGRTASKSFPTIQRLYKGLLGIDLTAKIEVIRTQVITTDKEGRLDKLLL